MDNSSEPAKRSKSFSLVRMLLILIVLLVVLCVIDLVFITSLGTNASTTFQGTARTIGGQAPAKQP